VGEQWDVYRGIRDLVDNQSDGDWAGHLPRTNVMWLSHLTRVLLYSTTSLKKPRSKSIVKATTRKASAGNPNAEASENKKYYNLLLDLERTLMKVSKESTAVKPRTRQKKVAVIPSSVVPMTTMAEFMILARGKGWIV
jgi:hypothetical protein